MEISRETQAYPMRKSRFTTEQIVEILSQGEGLVSKKELCARHGISVQTFYRWRTRYGDRVESPVRRIRELEDENSRLRQLLIEKELEGLRRKDTRRR